MRRRVQPDTLSRTPQHALQLRSDRAFAVRAADVNDAVAAVRVAGVRQQPLRPLEAPADAAGEAREQLVEQIRVGQGGHAGYRQASFGDRDGDGYGDGDGENRDAPFPYPSPSP